MDLSISKEGIPTDTDLVEITTEFTRAMSSRPTVVDIPEEDSVLYVGDLHGNYNCLKEALGLAEAKSVDAIVFLGDYVDRGEKQIETLRAIMELALRSEKAIPLRGNHESSDMISRYGFQRELLKHYRDQQAFERVLESVNSMFDFLPLAAVKNGSGSLTVHAGIPVNPDFDLIRAIPKPHSSMSTVNSKYGSHDMVAALEQLRWNDPQTWQFSYPDTETLMNSAKNKRFFPSPRGFGIYLFNERALEGYLVENGFSRLIRSHESIRGAFENLWDGKLLHVFSAYPYESVIREGCFLFERAWTSGEPAIEVLNPSGEVLEIISI